MTESQRRPPEPYEVLSHLKFDDPPTITNRDDALYLLDRMLEADMMECYDLALEALRDAIENGVI